MESRKALGIGLAIAGGVAALAGAAALLSSRRNGGILGRGRLPRSSGTVRKGGKTLTVYDKGSLPIKQRIAILQHLHADGMKDPEMRKLALAITGFGGHVTVGGRSFHVKGANCPARDGMCEVKAIGDWTAKNVRYTGDIAPHKLASGRVEGVDLFQSAARTVEFGGGDCLPAGTLVLTSAYDLVPVEDVKPGQKIWGLDRWSEVLDIWWKGILPVDAVFLNNGSTFKATAGHKVYAAFCPKHVVSQKCSCPLSMRGIERIPISEMEPGAVLLQPERIALGREAMDPGRAYIEGLYLSDGFCSHDSSFDISGQDGCPKELQKSEVQTICERLGIRTTWQRKYINVQDKDWTIRMQQMGGRAWLKHALSLDLDEAAARELLRGIMADSGANTNGNGRTFTSTSRTLMLQTRLLHRMLGVSCSERYIVDHGGLGEHPIWRLGVRDQERSDGNAEKLLRVKSIERAVMSLPTFDLTTDDHRVYLPEADVVVSNCDDHTLVNANLLNNNGIMAVMRITSTRPGPQEDYSHIYSAAGLPKYAPTKLVAVDTTLPVGKHVGFEMPFGKKVDAIA